MGQTLLLVQTIFGSPVYEWRLHRGRIQLGTFTDKLTFILFMSGQIKVQLLNSSLTLYICRWSLECGAQRVQMNSTYITSISHVSFFFFRGALLCLCTVLSTCCCTGYSHKLEVVCRFSDDIVSVSVGMSEQILLWHEKGCIQSGSR